MNTNEKRNDVIDIARGIGIVLVIIGHLNHFFDDASRTKMLIYSFHMPLFLILSGVCQKNLSGKTTRELVYNKFRTILIPYFIFGMITFLAAVWDSPQQGRNWINGLFIGLGREEILGFNIPLWFLSMFFMANIIYIFINKFSQKITEVYVLEIATVLSIVGALAGFWLTKHYGAMWFNIDTALVGQLFIQIGTDLKYLSEKYPIINSKTAQYVIFVVAVCLWLGGVVLNGRVDMNGRCYNNQMVYIITAVAGSVCILYVAKLIEKISGIRKIASYIGESSLYVMAYHVPASKILYDGRIMAYLPTVIRENVWQKNVIGLGYIIIGTIGISLFMKLLHKNIHIQK